MIKGQIEAEGVTQDVTQTIAILRVLLTHHSSENCNAANVILIVFNSVHLCPFPPSAPQSWPIQAFYDKYNSFGSSISIQFT